MLNSSSSPKGTATETIFKRCSALFGDGRISDVWRIISSSEIHASQRFSSEISKKEYYYFLLGCALYGFGDLESIKYLNRTLNLRFLPMLRYRLSLRLRDFTTASKIRKHPDVTPLETSDFRCSLGLHCLWQHKYKWGFYFYQDRVRATNFSKILPKSLRYMAATSYDDFSEGVVLEQGVGEVIICLRHLRESCPRVKRFFGLPRYESLCRELFPEADFFDINSIPDAFWGASVCSAMDILGIAWSHKASLAPSVRLRMPSRDFLAKPIFGICWRGGSAQNRREERHITLRHFLDLLPSDCLYAPLQFDISDEELHILASDRRIIYPTDSLKGDVLPVLDLISRLCGTITVDSANVHFSAATGTPVLVIMNKTAHWLWGPDAAAEWTYPEAETVSKSDLRRSTLEAWCVQKRAAFRSRRAPTIIRSASRNHASPIFMASVPRSGSSTAMEIIARHDVWVGNVVPGNMANPRGFFENIGIRVKFIKEPLAKLGFDPAGVLSLPDPARLPIIPEFSNQILTEISSQGYDGSVPWAFKDPKISLLWPLFARAFPEARWLIPRRSRDRVVESLSRVHFMRKYNQGPEFWNTFVACYDSRLDDLMKSGATVLEFDADQLLAGDSQDFLKIIGLLGIEPSSSIATDVIQMSRREPAEGVP